MTEIRLLPNQINSLETIVDRVLSGLESGYNPPQDPKQTRATLIRLYVFGMSAEALRKRYRSSIL